MKKKKVICLILLVVGCISSIIIINYLKPDKTSNSLIAVYYEDENGNYQKSKENKFYKEGYALDKEKSKCDNGSTIDWNNETNKIKITGTKTDKCNIYLSKKEYTLLTQNTEIKDKDAKLTNILGTDGNFESEGIWIDASPYPGDVACIINNDKVKYGNYSCKLEPTKDLIEITSYTKKTYYLNNLHNYYARISIYSDNFSYGGAQIFWPAAEPSLMVTSVNIGWNDYSIINNRSSFSNDYYQVRIDFNNNYIEDKMYFDGLMVIDLTESYGESLPTQDWLDKHLIYFDNSVDIKTTTGKEGIFEVNDPTGTFRCSEGGNGKIENGKVVITGTNVNMTCILE